MQRHHTWTRILTAATLAALLLPAVSETAPVGDSITAITVSPGGPSASELTGPACPTFSWGLLLTDEVELAIYPVWDDGAIDAESPAASLRVPGTVTSWTSAGADCLVPGHRYAWSVRGFIDGQAATEWSEPRYFEVLQAPSMDEVEVALDTLRRFRDAQVVSAAPRRPEPIGNVSKARPRAIETPSETSSSRSVAPLTPPSSWGISSEVAEASGAAIYGKNTDGAAGFFDGDLAVAGVTTVETTFSGFGGTALRAVTGGGAISAAVSGENDLGGEGFLGLNGTGVYGKATNPNYHGVFGQHVGGGLAGKFLGDVEMDKLMLASLDCAGCVGSENVLDRAIDSSDIAQDAIDAFHLADNSVHTGILGFDAVHAENIETGAVGSSAIADGTIMPVDMGFPAYRSRADLYYVVETEYQQDPGHFSAHAACHDADDIAIGGGCYALNLTAQLYRNAPFNWGAGDIRPAGWSCAGYTQGNDTLEARLYCISR